MILWLFGAYLFKKFSLIDLRAVGILHGDMAIKSSIDKDTRGVAEVLASSHPLVWTRVSVWLPLLSSRESVTKKSLKISTLWCLIFLKIWRYWNIPHPYPLHISNRPTLEKRRKLDVDRAYKRRSRGLARTPLEHRLTFLPENTFLPYILAHGTIQMLLELHSQINIFTQKKKKE